MEIHKIRSFTFDHAAVLSKALTANVENVTRTGCVCHLLNLAVQAVLGKRVRKCRPEVDEAASAEEDDGGSSSSEMEEDKISGNEALGFDGTESVREMTSDDESGDKLEDVGDETDLRDESVKVVAEKLSDIMSVLDNITHVFRYSSKKRKLLQSLSGNKFLVPQCHNATRWHSSLAQMFSIWVVRQRLQMWNDHYRHLHELCLPDFQSLQEIIGLLVLVRVVSRKLEQTTTSAAEILPLIHKLEGSLGPNSSLLLWDEDWQIQRKLSSAELQPFTAMLRSSMLKSLRFYMNKHV